MIIINDKLRIRKLEEFKEVKLRKGGIENQWLRVGYYSNLKMALLGILDKKLFDSAEEEMALKDVIKKIDEAKKEIQNFKFQEIEWIEW